MHESFEDIFILAYHNASVTRSLSRDVPFNALGLSLQLLAIITHLMVACLPLLL
jgi:hypothetical protein